MEAKSEIHIIGEKNKSLNKVFNRKTNKLQNGWMRSDDRVQNLVQKLHKDNKSKETSRKSII